MFCSVAPATLYCIYIFFSFFNATIYTHVILLLNDHYDVILLHYSIIIALSGVVGVSTYLIASFFLNKLSVNAKAYLPYLLMSLGLIPLIFSFHFLGYYLWLISATLLILTIAQSLHLLIFPTLISTMVGEKNFYSTNSFLYFLNYSFLIFSPVLATYVYLEKLIFFFTAATLVFITVFSIILTKIEFNQRPEHVEILNKDFSYTACIKYLLERSHLLVLLLLFVCTKPIFVIIDTVWPSYFLEYNHASNYGIVESSAIIGMIAAALIAKLLNFDKNHFAIIFISLATCSMTIVFIGTTSLLAILIILNFILGASITICDISHHTVWQKSIPSNMQSKIFAIKMIAPTLSTFPINILSIYLISDHFDSTNTSNNELNAYSILYWSAGLSALLIIALFSIISRKILNVNSKLD